MSAPLGGAQHGGLPPPSGFAPREGTDAAAAAPGAAAAAAAHDGGIQWVAAPPVEAMMPCSSTSSASSGLSAAGPMSPSAHPHVPAIAMPRGLGRVMGEGCAVVDPIAMEMGGQVERLLQTRLLRAAHNCCHGLDDGTRALPLLDWKDRALLSIWHRWSTLQRLDVTGGLIARVGRALCLTQQEVVAVPASPQLQPALRRPHDAASVSREHGQQLHARPSPPKSPSVASNGAGGEKPDAKGNDEEEEEDDDDAETGSGGLTEEKGDGEEADDELDEDEDEDEEVEELLNEGDAAVAAAALASAFPGFIASLDDGASLCAMYSLEPTRGRSSTGKSHNGHRPWRRRGAGSPDQGHGMAEDLRPQSLRVYVSEAFAATFFPARTYRGMLTRRLPEYVHAHLVEQEDRHGFLASMAAHLLEATLTAGQEPAQAARDGEDEQEQEQEQEQQAPQAPSPRLQADGEERERNPTSQARDERDFSQVLRFMDRHGRGFLALCRVRLCLTRRGGVAGAIAITPLPQSKYTPAFAWAGADPTGAPGSRTVLTHCSVPRVHPWTTPDSAFHPRHQRQRPAPHEQLENRLHFLDWRRCRPEGAARKDGGEEDESDGQEEAHGAERTSAPTLPFEVPTSVASSGGSSTSGGGNGGGGAPPAKRRKESHPSLRPAAPRAHTMPAQYEPLAMQHLQSTGVMWTPIGASATGGGAGGGHSLPPIFNQNPFPRNPVPARGPGGPPPRPPPIMAPSPTAAAGPLSPESASPFHRMAGLVGSPAPLPPRGRGAYGQQPDSPASEGQGEVWFDAFCEAFYGEQEQAQGHGQQQQHHHQEGAAGPGPWGSSVVQLPSPAMGEGEPPGPMQMMPMAAGQQCQHN